AADCMVAPSLAFILYRPVVEPMLVDWAERATKPARGGLGIRQLSERGRHQPERWPVGRGYRVDHHRNESHWHHGGQIRLWRRYERQSQFAHLDHGDITPRLRHSDGTVTTSGGTS